MDWALTRGSAYGGDSTSPATLDWRFFLENQAVNCRPCQKRWLKTRNGIEAESFACY